MRHIKIIYVLLGLMGMGLYPFVSAYTSPCPDLDITVKNQKISLYVKDSPLDCVLGQVSRHTGVPIKLWPGDQQRITMFVENLSFDQFFDRIGIGRALVYAYLPKTKEYQVISADLAQKIPLQANILNSPKPPPPVKRTKEHAQTEPKAKPQTKPGELLVRFKDYVSTEQMLALHKFLGSRILKKSDRTHLHCVQFDPQLTRETAINLYMATGLVQTAAPHALRSVHQIIPNDPKFSEQWGLTAIQAPDAWEISRGSQDVIIALIDTGVNVFHPDLGGNIWINQAEAQGQTGVDDDQNGYNDDIYGYDFADDDPFPFDVAGHGTHVAGIIGAVSNNAAGIAGVCPKVKIMVLKVQADDSNDIETFDIIEAVDYAKDQGATIVNCSFGGGDYQIDEYLAFDQFARANDGLILCSAGNDGQNIQIYPSYPASYDIAQIISIAASAQSTPAEYVLAEYSNWGSTDVDLMAPGDQILSTLLTPSTQASLAIGTDPTLIPAEGFTFAATTDGIGIKASLINCGLGYPDQIPNTLAGNIALIQRGNRDGIPFYFYQKIALVQQAGAIGAIIYNSEPGDFGGTLVTPEDWVPVVSISQENGGLLLSKLPTSVTIVNQMIETESFYDFMSGTSMSAGFVSGAVGLLRAHAPQKSGVDIKNILLSTTDPIASAQGNLVSGGQLNLFKALSTLPLPGDLNKDYTLRIIDTVTGLKILSGQSADGISQDFPHWDSDGDGKAGLPESTQVLQKSQF